MRHLIVRHDPGVFYAWPANCGIWSWGEEIAVGFTRGAYRASTDNHSVDREAPQVCVIARSDDAGERWQLEEPDNFAEGSAFGEADTDESQVPLDDPIDFTHPDLAIRCRRGQILVSTDRCRSWAGPYGLSGLDPGGILTSRTDYLTLRRHEALFFVSYRPESLASTKLPDRAFTARTWDLGYPRSVLRPDGKIVTTYYFTTEERAEQHIAATLWDPDDAG